MHTPKCWDNGKTIINFYMRRSQISEDADGDGIVLLLPSEGRMDVTIRNSNEVEISVMLSTTPIPENTRPSQIIDPGEEDEVYIPVRRQQEQTIHCLLYSKRHGFLRKEIGYRIY